MNNSSLTVEQLLEAVLLIPMLMTKVEQLEQALSCQRIMGGTAKPVGVKGAAAFLGTTDKGVYELVSKAKIPVHRKSGRLYFFIKELEAYVRSGDAPKPRVSASKPRKGNKA